MYECVQFALFHHPVEGIHSPIDSLYHCCKVLKDWVASRWVTADTEPVNAKNAPDINAFILNLFERYLETNDENKRNA